VRCTINSGLEKQSLLPLLTDTTARVVDHESIRGPEYGQTSKD